ncbi:hypothetical protein L0Z13_03680 [Burkholderia multivorans]|uniref:hypothetical protein n=1 Tax=Burkholderia multivorans TaxID=87883 RepID=UPI0005D9D877|nr:hypothetical protein [Burkholderia multivorans]AJY18424.1 hypothetical protein NP80_3159 [Burkholderia multivorans ATCC BAA-247]MCO1436924.1 hypothetical protein [Burkholderia multivorans]MDN7510586.1 hypothetical protein [Burkholderia multivorans]UQN60762.1 hypothetical protein L0Y94_13880 [Burkholderia multivorans]UQN65926.1 hypothetical protein L0Y92_27475 [Burkholderia multivorans]
MRVLTKEEISHASGAITCTLNPNPINYAELGGAIALGALGGNWPGAILGGGHQLSVAKLELRLAINTDPALTLTERRTQPPTR